MSLSQPAHIIVGGDDPGLPYECGSLHGGDHVEQERLGKLRTVRQS
jgi:hypothetical protein